MTKPGTRVSGSAHARDGRYTDDRKDQGLSVRADDRDRERYAYRLRERLGR